MAFALIESLRRNRARARQLVADRTPRRARQAVRGAIRLGRRAGYARARWARPLGTRPPHYLAITAIFRDEARYLAEWVTFHRLQGVERFWLYDNGSTDAWRDALEPELRAGIVEVTPWPIDPGQLSAYADSLKRHRKEARWLAFLDSDEFLFSPTGRTLPDMLRDFEGHPAVAANWRTFGTSGHVEPPDGLVTESYVWRPRDEVPMNEYFKSIVFPRKTSAWVQSAHVFRVYGGTVGEDRDPVNGSTRRPPSVKLLRINHYWSRSVSELARKWEQREPVLGTPRDKGEGMRLFADAIDEKQGILVPRDEVQDESILQFVPELRRALAAR